MRTVDNPQRVLSRPVEPYALRRREALYRWFASACRESGYHHVLVAGCGDGFGAAVLASSGLSVVAADPDLATVGHASRTWRFGSLQFRRADAGHVHERDGAFDAVLSPFVVEHVADPVGIVAEVRRLVRDGGMTALATPNRLVVSPGRTVPIDPSHTWEFTPAEMAALVSRYFAQLQMYGVFHGRRLRVADRLTGRTLVRTLAHTAAADRSWWLARIARNVATTDFRIHPGTLRDAIDLVAVCRV